MEHYENEEMNTGENIDEFENEKNYYEEGMENMEEDEEYLERDRFEQTIIQPIGEDIIQIENYPIYFYEENDFCDYEYTPEDND